MQSRNIYILFPLDSVLVQFDDGRIVPGEIRFENLLWSRYIHFSRTLEKVGENEMKSSKIM